MVDAWKIIAFRRRRGVQRPCFVEAVSGSGRRSTIWKTEFTFGNLLFIDEEPAMLSHAARTLDRLHLGRNLC